MKIKKHNKDLLEAKLLEAEEVTTSDGDGVIATDDSIAEIADKIADTVELASEGETTVSDAEAAKAAAEIKDAADAMGAEHAAFDPGEDFEHLGVENPITKILDVALKGAKRDKRRKTTKFGHNVLISGLPGSGKTATIYDWAYSRGVHLVEVNAKNNDLDAYINGYTTRDMDDPKWTKQAFSKNLMGLDEPNSVLFLDEYNRQVKQSIRGSLYTLINNHKIVGDGPNGMHEFENMLFTVAAINPAIRTDKGATALNDAEKTRFLHKLKGMDSSSDTTIEFMNKYYTKRIKELDPSDEYYREDLEGYLGALDLGIFLVTHDDFAYDGEKQLLDLDLKNRTMLNQRTLTDGINAVDGDPEDFKLWVENSSDFLDENIEMIVSILKRYIRPSFEDLCRGAGVDPESGKVTTKSGALEASGPAGEPEAAASEDIEDDDDFFIKSEFTGKVRAKQPFEVETLIANVLKDW